MAGADFTALVRDQLLDEHDAHDDGQVPGIGFLGSANGMSAESYEPGLMLRIVDERSAGTGGIG